MCRPKKWQYCYHPSYHYENNLAITSMCFNTRVSASVFFLCVFLQHINFFSELKFGCQNRIFLKFSQLHLQVIESQQRKLIIPVPPQFCQDLFIEMPGLGFISYFKVPWNFPIDRAITCEIFHMSPFSAETLLPNSLLSQCCFTAWKCVWTLIMVKNFVIFPHIKISSNCSMKFKFCVKFIEHGP